MTRFLFRTDNPNIEITHQRFYMMMQRMTFSAFFFPLIMAFILSSINTSPTSIYFTLINSAILLLTFLVIRSGHLRIGFYCFLYLTCLDSLLGIVTFGWKSFFFLYIFLMIPILFFNNILKKTEYILQLVFFSLVVMLAVYLSFTYQPSVDVTSLQIQTLSYVNALITGVTLAIVSFWDNKNAATVAKRLVEANEKLAYQASRDPLTNLLNRRSMNELIEKESVRSKRSGKSYGLIMADIDDFKQVNDQFGHSAGDFVLLQMAGIFQNTLRQQDSVARWGGEEFLVLLPETDESGAQIAAEKLRDIIAHSIFYYGGNSIKVTVSFGHIICEPEYDWVDALKRADKALYYGKQHGKNVAIWANDDRVELESSVQVTESSG